MIPRMMGVAVYRSKPNAHTAPGGYWFLRVVNPVSGESEETPITAGKAEQFIVAGVPRLADGGNL